MNLYMSPVINDQALVLFSFALGINESGREIFDPPSGLTLARERYNGLANLISRITGSVLRSEMRLAIPRCIKCKWNGAKAAHCAARGSEGGTSRQKMSSRRERREKGQRWTIKSSYYPYYGRRCERTRTRRPRAESLSHNVHPLSISFTVTDRTNVNTDCQTYEQ